MEPRPGDNEPHTPSPSIWPVGFAVGIACILAGLVVSRPAVIVGVLIAVLFGALWARDSMRSASTPPPEEAPPATPAAATADADALELEDGELATFPRNQFLELTTLGLGAVITGVVALPVVGFAVLPAFTGQEHKTVDLGTLDNYPQDEWREVKFRLDPKLGYVTRRTVFVRNNGEGDGGPSFTLISNRCVHLGCPVQASGPREDNQRKIVRQVQGAPLEMTPVLPANFSCPCHGGAYDTEGNRVAGPPVRALDRYKYSIIDGRLHLVEVYSVAEVEGEGKNAKIKAYGPQGPGEHVDGLEGWFYPIQPQDLEQ
ncbi:MAG TPA: ubiquinol-cytochrome c reductase iron-sulfur subunit [Gaiellaceae bacterium]|nr:ubiquinol-cytochrome c reductase iron-sulfur subunit [Gaiellaceae bacterium]